MSGRAGRLALTSDFGRAIFVTESKFEADVWLRHYAGGEFESVTPTLKDAPLEDHVLDSSRGVRVGAVPGAGGRFVAGQLHRPRPLARQDGPRGHSGRPSTRGWTSAAPVGWFTPARAGALEVTKLGLAVAGRGIGVATAVAMAEWAAEARRASSLTEVEVITLLGLTPAGSNIYVTLGREEDRQLDYRDEIVERARLVGAQD